MFGAAKAVALSTRGGSESGVNCAGAAVVLAVHDRVQRDESNHEDRYHHDGNVPFEAHADASILPAVIPSLIGIVKVLPGVGEDPGRHHPHVNEHSGEFDERLGDDYGRYDLIPRR